MSGCVLLLAAIAAGERGSAWKLLGNAPDGGTAPASKAQPAPKAHQGAHLSVFDEDELPDGLSEQRLRAMEERLIGRAHAAEHAGARAAARLAAVGAANSALSSDASAQLRAAGPPSVVGEWTQAPFQIPHYAINTALLPTGKVLFWGRPPLPVGGGPRPNVGVAALWTPSLGTGAGAFENVPPPVIDVDGPGGQPPAPAPIFCSGQSFLPDGQVLVAGGTQVYAGTFPDDPYTNYAGLNKIFTFDPFSETWTQQPNLARGRWYPSQTLLPDGRTIVSSGFSEEPPGGVTTNDLEVFNPPQSIGGQGSVEQKPSADRGLGLYPRLLSLRDGNALLAGILPKFSAILDKGSFTWDDLPDMSRQRQGGSVVRQPLGAAGSDTFTAIGGYDRSQGPGPFYPATNTTETMDASQQLPSWGADATTQVARANANTVSLPDGSMVTIGGGSGFAIGGGGGYVTHADGRARQVEVYDPASQSWMLGPAQEEDRAYHSTAVLLPDGRVFSAGDDFHTEEPGGGASLTDTAEIYSPPYLFKGPRPVIGSAPAAVRWGDDFGIASGSPDLDRAVLVAPGATTHGFDMNQRVVPLQLVNNLGGQGVDVLAPPSAGVAPAGYYMLFLLNDQGVPSVASWVKIDPAAPDQPVLGPPPPSADFNGDGFDDLAVGAPSEDDGAVGDAGAVNVIYGSASGATGAGNQLWTRASLGAGSGAAGDRFGAALVTDDLNRDGYADLAVGAPGEDVGGAADSGAVHVILGSAAGLSATGNQVWSQDSAGIADAAEPGDRFGAALAAGDFNDDGGGDLAIGAPTEGVGTQGSAGAASVIYGGANGLASAGNQLWHQNIAGIAEGVESGDAFGAALALGDLNGDGRDDLAVGVPSESVGTTAGAGAVNVIYGGAGGLASAGNQLWHQNIAGILDASEGGDALGSALALGDLNGDGRDDLAVGVPSESVGTTAGAGAVNVIYGGAGGLASAGNQLWHQNIAGILDASEGGDALGSALALGDLNGDGRDDLAVGVPSESVGTTAGAGAVNVIYGGAGGLASAGNQLWNQDSADILDASEGGDAFGSALAWGDLSGNARDDLVVGVPSESVGATAGAGAVNVLYGFAGGLASTGNQLWHQDSPSVLDSSEPSDQFGAPLAAGVR